MPGSCSGLSFALKGFPSSDGFPVVAWGKTEAWHCACTEACQPPSGQLPPGLASARSWLQVRESHGSPQQRLSSISLPSLYATPSPNPHVSGRASFQAGFHRVGAQFPCFRGRRQGVPMSHLYLCPWYWGQNFSLIGAESMSDVQRLSASFLCPWPRSESPRFLSRQPALKDANFLVHEIPRQSSCWLTRGPGCHLYVLDH